MDGDPFAVKIGVDASSLIQKKTGIGSFAHAFLEVLQKEMKGHELIYYKPAAKRDLRTFERMRWEALTLPRLVERDRVRVLYSPGFSPPPHGNFKKVVTVHDLIGLIYPGNVGLISRYYWSTWLPRNIRRADAFIASSESTRRDMERLLHIPASSVEVLPLAVNERVFRPAPDPAAVDAALERYGIRRPYLLSVGTLEPRKNSLRLAQAFQLTAARTNPLQLVFAGKDGGMEKKLRHHVDEHNLRDRVKILGYVPDGDLAHLYAGSIGYAMVSLYEGFGLPALEGMSCGVSGIVSGVSSLPEVVGDTALTVDPEDPKAIAAAIEKFASDPALRERLAAKALERSRQFSYARTAKAMVGIFERAAA